LVIGTFGSDDPTRATLPFVAASGALEAGHAPEICLLGEASYLMKDQVLAAIHGIGFPPLSEVVPKPKNARFITAKELSEIVVAADRVVSI
jgi:predicted peroxiredoxin